MHLSAGKRSVRKTTSVVNGRNESERVWVVSQWSPRFASFRLCSIDRVQIQRTTYTLATAYVTRRLSRSFVHVSRPDIHRVLQNSLQVLDWIPSDNFLINMRVNLLVVLWSLRALKLFINNDGDIVSFLSCTGYCKRVIQFLEIKFRSLIFYKHEFKLYDNVMVFKRLDIILWS